MTSYARMFITLGIVFLVIGGALYAVNKIGGGNVRIPFGRLPGDIRIEGENFTCLLPIVSSILLSILLTIALNVIIRLIHR